MPQVEVDLITERPDGTFVMYLVEQGPWTSEPTDHLRRIQDRLYDYFDVAVDGHLASLTFECEEKTLGDGEPAA